MKERTSTAEALSFLLTHIVVEQGKKLELDQLQLFQMNNLAQLAADKINSTDGAIPHEVIEQIAAEYLSQE